MMMRFIDLLFDSAIVIGRLLASLWSCPGEVASCQLQVVSEELSTGN
jgi:hypothetical protein